MFILISYRRWHEFFGPFYSSSTLTLISSTLFALAKQSKNLGAYKMARTAYDKLQVSSALSACREGAISF